MNFTSLLLHIVAAFALVELCTAQERECNGRDNFFSYSGDFRIHYERMKSQYSGCTSILGNLEITHLEDPSVTYNMSFLKTIRRVSGFVLLAFISNVRTIPLDNLEEIGGFDRILQRSTQKQYSIAVILSDSLKRLRLPKLKEITVGGVLFQLNPYLGYVETVNWTSIVKRPGDPITLNITGFDRTVAQRRPLTSCPGGRGWNSNPVMCQRAE